MGSALWLGCGAAAFLFARIVPYLRRRARWPELMTALVTAMLLGVLATALDFGGWREADWRAGVFVFLGAFAATGVTRLTISRVAGGSS